ncbi:MAG: hypothetical protein F6K52_33165, partial [Moorea sp. SIO3H5]|nr:hypothetical protein [Moorena sp. SIO3H5]
MPVLPTCPWHHRQDACSTNMSMASQARCLFYQHVHGITGKMPVPPR